MGLFEKIFKRKTKETIIFDDAAQKSVKPNISITTSVVVNNEIPNYQGKYAKAVFLNAYQRASAIKDNSEYQRYLIYECGIKNPSGYHQQMITEGYLQECSLEEQMDTLRFRN